MRMGTAPGSVVSVTGNLTSRTRSWRMRRMVGPGGTLRRRQGPRAPDRRRASIRRGDALHGAPDPAMCQTVRPSQRTTEFAQMPHARPCQAIRTEGSGPSAAAGDGGPMKLTELDVIRSSLTQEMAQEMITTSRAIAAEEASFAVKADPALERVRDRGVGRGARDPPDRVRRQPDAPDDGHRVRAVEVGPPVGQPSRSRSAGRARGASGSRATTARRSRYRRTPATRVGPTSSGPSWAMPTREMSEIV